MKYTELGCSSMSLLPFTSTSFLGEELVAPHLGAPSVVRPLAGVGPVTGRHHPGQLVGAAGLYNHPHVVRSIFNSNQFVQLWDH